MKTGRFTGYGRPVLTKDTDGPLPRLRLWVIPGAGRHLLLRDGAVGFLLIHLATWWHRYFHRLDAPHEVWDEWGHADRPVRGTTDVWSEHAGGVAEDLDATRHPRGVPILRTFTYLATVRIRRRLRMYHGVLEWGGNFKRTPDGMHFEWARGVPLAEAERQARRLFGTKIGQDILRANPGARQVIES